MRMEFGAQARHLLTSRLSPDSTSILGLFQYSLLPLSSLVENVPGFTSLEMSPLQLRQAACRYSGLARIGVAPDAYPRPRRRTGSGAIGTSKTLLVLRRVLLFPHWLGEAPERRSWVGKREDSRAGFARLSLLLSAFLLQGLESFACEHLLVALVFERMIQRGRFAFAMLR